MTEEQATADQQAMHEAEPDVYNLLSHHKLRTHTFGDKEYRIYFNCEPSVAGGYTDSEIIWIHDSIKRPEDFMEVVLHEGLHAMFPELSEAKVHQAGEQLASFLCRMFKLKSKRGLPELIEFKP